MSTPPAVKHAALPSALVEGAAQAAEGTLASICGNRPQRLPGEVSIPTSDVMGILTFLGDVSWSFALLLPEATASALIQTFVGMELPFDGPDMGDAVGELVNVIGGEVVAQLERRRIKAQMSLPLVARGHDVEVFIARAGPAVCLAYQMAQGPLWVKLTAEDPAHLPTRRSGA